LISADVVGYSRLTADDRIAAIRALTLCRGRIAAGVKKNRGRLDAFVGDNLLAEFSNTPDAVQCADRIRGAGAVSSEIVRRAKEAGAASIVKPGFAYRRYGAN